jgi:hypothetical protein
VRKAKRAGTGDADALLKVPEGFLDSTNKNARQAPRWLVVYAGQQCIGHLFFRGKGRYEAVDDDDVSLSIFPNEHEAAAAITAAHTIIHGGGKQ